MSVRAETQIDLARVDDGSPGTPGTNGATFTPSVAADGDISWTNDGGLPNPATQNIMGPQGNPGSPGTPGANGVSVTSVEPQYYLSTSDSSATGGSWSSTPPAFVSGYYYWTRDYITYSDGTDGTSTAVYNSGMTQAAQDALDAKTIADDTEQHFWFTSTGVDTGAHITEVPQDEWNDVSDPNYHSGGNLLARSNGIAVRDGLQEFATFEASGQTFNNKYGYDVFTVGRLADSTYSGKSNWVEYSNESPFTLTLAWDCNSVNSIHYYNSSYQEITGISVSYTTSGRNITFSASACTTLQNNNVKYISVQYSAQGEFPYYTFGSDGVGDIGKYSVREGENTVASGDTSHAEGEGSIASGGNSHAEGEGSIASGGNSHAEGRNTTASDEYAHAEGFESVASNQSSHAQNWGTIADKQAQTALGTFNVKDTASSTVHPSGIIYLGKYAVIVGNGTSTSNRSNALTIDWLGNVVASGTISADGHSDPIGWYDAHNNTTSISSGTSYASISASAITLSAGRYIMFGSARFAGNATGYRGICIFKGSTNLGRSNASQQTLPSSSWTTSLNCSIFEAVESSTTYYLGVYQNSGGSLSVSWDFYAVRIR